MTLHQSLAFLEAFLLHVKFWSATWTKDSCDLQQHPAGQHRYRNPKSNKKTDRNGSAVQIEKSLRQVQTALGSGWKSWKSRQALNSTASIASTDVDGNGWEWMEMVSPDDPDTFS